MSLSVRRFVTRCRTPPGLGIDAPLIDSLVRSELRSELGRELKSRWPARPDVCRVRDVRVRVEISADDMAAGRLPNAWASALSGALLETLALPGDQRRFARAVSRADWLARAIGHFLEGSASGRWEYAEFRHLFGLPTHRTVEALLTSEPGETIEVLWRLRDRGLLERTLSVLDEQALARVIAVAPAQAGAAEGRLAISDVLGVAGALLAGGLGFRTDELGAPRLSLLLFVHMQDRGADGSNRPTPSPRRVHRALLTLAALVARSGVRTTDQAAARTYPAEVQALVDRLSTGAEARGDASDAGDGPELQAVLERLAERLPDGQATADGEWVRTGCAGLFLLCDLLERLAWLRRAANALGVGNTRARELSFFTMGLGLSLIGRFERAPAGLDPGLAVFSGCDAPPDMIGLRAFLASGDAETRAAVLEALLDGNAAGSEPGTDAGNTAARELAAGSWDTTFDLLAAELTRGFAERIRGYRTASRSFVVENFLATGGRLLLEERQITVHLATNPFHVALRISGADQPLGAVAWLGARDLRFVLDV